MSENNNSQKAWFEFKDMLAGAAFPVMLQLILSVTLIGLASTMTTDFALSIVMLVLGELGLGAAYIIFGRQSGITSVRRLVQNSKKRELGANDMAAQYGTGEYSAYKGFVIGLISCAPYIIFQFIECVVPNSFTYFVLQYVFGWAALPLAMGEAQISPWLNFLFVIYPVAVHGVAYIIAAHKEWNKQQQVAEMQTDPKDKQANKGDK